MSEGFLSRWSRRKRETPAEEPAPPPAPPAAIVPPSPEAEATAEGGAAEGEEITPEELAALPPLDALTAETDVVAFLRRGVPQALRNAALRRAWALDPKVRDFVCEAREYAYDWNVPGGVPGNSDLLPTDDVPAMIRQIFGDGPPAQAVAGGTSPPVSAAPVAEPSPRDPVSHSRRPTAPDRSCEASPVRHPEEPAAREEEAEPTLAPSPEPTLIQGENAVSSRPAALVDPRGAEVGSTVSPPSFPRRHGRAKPI